MLSALLNSKFAKNRRVPLGGLVERIPSGTTIPRGTLVVVASGDRRIRLRILDRDVLHKGLSEPLALNSFAAAHRVTPNYLLWYLSQDAVTKHLLAHATGAVFIRVPRAVLHAVPVPLPTRVTRIRLLTEFAVLKTDNRFTQVIAGLHRDYLLNVANKRFRTAAILAGAICEVILYQLLVEHRVNPDLLKSDRGLGFGKLLDYVRVLRARSETI